MRFLPTPIELFTYYLWNLPVKGQKPSPWEQRKLDHAEKTRLEEEDRKRRYQEWLRNREINNFFSGDDDPKDVGLRGKNRYLHYDIPAGEAAHDIKKMIKAVDRTYFNGIFSKEGVLPKISWWWRGAKSDAKSTYLGLACLEEGEILINCRLNSTEFSSSSMELLIYHEMLHFALYFAGFHYGHTGAFNYFEHQFRGFREHDKGMSSFAAKHVVAKTIGSLGLERPTKLKEIKRCDKTKGYRSEAIRNQLLSMRS